MTTSVCNVLRAIVEREFAFPTREAVLAYYRTLVDSLALSFVAYVSELDRVDLHTLASELADGDFINTERPREMLIDNALANFQRHISATPFEELRSMVINLHDTYNKFPWTIPHHPTMGAIPIIPPRVFRTYAGVVKGEAPKVFYDPRCCPNGDNCVLAVCNRIHVHF